MNIVYFRPDDTWICFGQGCRYPMNEDTLWLNIHVQIVKKEDNKQIIWWILLTQVSTSIFDNFFLYPKERITVQLYTRCHLEYLPRAMADKNEWWEMVKEICAISMPRSWWWWSNIWKVSKFWHEINHKLTCH